MLSALEAALTAAKVMVFDEVEKNEAGQAQGRLVAKEIAAKQGPRRDVFAATPSAVANKILVIIACAEEESVSSGDFDRAFMHAPTDEPVYVKPPPEDYEDAMLDEDPIAQGWKPGDEYAHAQHAALLQNPGHREKCHGRNRIGNPGIGDVR